MVQANPLSFLHFQSQGSLFSAVFLLLKVMAWIRSKVRAGMSLSLLQLHADRSALAVRSLASQVRVLLLMSIHLGMRVYFASRRPWEAPTIAAEEGWGLMGPGGGHPCPFPALRWLCPLLPGEPAWGSTAGSGSQCLPAAFCCGACAGLGGLSEISFFFLPFFSRLSNWKSFDTQWLFTQGQFLINTLHHLSSPKYVLSKEFPSSCSFMERYLKSQGDPEPVWALAFVVSQPVLPKWWTRGGNLLLPSRSNRLISRGQSTPTNLLCQMDASALIYVLKIAGHRYAQHCSLDPAFIALGDENAVGFSNASP